MLSDISGKKMSAMDVFSAAIKYMKEHLLHKLHVSETGYTETKKEEIRWVLTVPAIWSDTAKSFMREAAIKVFVYLSLLISSTESKSRLTSEVHVISNQTLSGISFLLIKMA